MTARAKARAKAEVLRLATPKIGSRWTCYGASREVLVTAVTAEGVSFRVRCYQFDSFLPFTHFWQFFREVGK